MNTVQYVLNFAYSMSTFLVLQCLIIVIDFFRGFLSCFGSFWWFWVDDSSQLLTSVYARAVCVFVCSLYINYRLS